MIKGVAGHLRALWAATDWSDPRTLRKFYAELRLWNEGMAREPGGAYAEFEAGDAEGKQASGCVANVAVQSLGGGLSRARPLFLVRGGCINGPTAGSAGFRLGISAHTT